MRKPQPTRRSGARPFAGARWLAVIAAAVVALAGLFGCAREAPPSMERPPPPVTVQAAEARDVPVYLDEIGRCVAREVVDVQPQVSGAITARHFEDGADVKTGDLLFTIDPRPFKARLDAAEATLAQRQAEAQLAETQFARVEDLVDTKAVSQEDFDARKSAAETARAQVRQGEAAVATARIDLEYCEIRSPIDGRTGHRLVDIGNVVTPIGGPLLTIQRLDPIYADFTVTETDLTSVQQNMARGTLAVQVRLPDEPGAPAVGELTFLDNAVQDATGTVRLRATIPNEERRFWPGRFVRVRLVLKTLPGAVLVPSEATQIAATGAFVYVVKEDGTAEMRPVTLGQQQEGLVVVQSGLSAGERVVVTGQIGVMPGGPVRVVEPGAATGAAAGEPPAPAGHS